VSRTSKWTAFILSACVPGAGQLAAGSWTCVGWFLAAGVIVAAGQGTRSWYLPVSTQPLQILAGIGVALLSAEHAKRLLEPRGNAVVRSCCCTCRAKKRSVDVLIALDVACSREDLWRTVGDLPRFLVLDPFHESITLMRGEPGVGVDLVLHHDSFGLRFSRFGRIIRWQPGYGYAFSDFSGRGPRTGFPHVFLVNLTPLVDDGGCQRTRLTIRVRGRWTSRSIPLWLGRFWIRLVCREHARLLYKGL
jgi:hypothetical protein